MKLHIVVTRLAIKWAKAKDENEWQYWSRHVMDLMDKYCRASLRNQTDQNFILLSIVDESIGYVGTPLENEVILSINSKTGDPARQEIINEINLFIESCHYYLYFDNIIITRLDSDDCLRNDFIHNVKTYFEDGKEKYIDLRKSYIHDEENNKCYDTEIYSKNFVSPFVSTQEKVTGKSLTCISFAVSHPEIPNHLLGKKANDLFALQVVHGDNISNRIIGDEINIDLSEYGLEV